MSFTSVMLIPKDCYYNKDTGAHLFAAFFKHRAETKRKYAKQFLRYLRKHEGKICLPVIKRPDLGHWRKGGQAQKSALGLESKLTKLLRDPTTLASENSKNDLSHFTGMSLDKQKRNTGCLEHQLAYHKKSEKQAQEEDTFEKPADLSNKET